MKFYFKPGSCTLGIHLILEEIGKPYEPIFINLGKREQFSPEYVAINPKSKVPALITDDGKLVTEYGAIATWLAKSNPEAKLFPDNLEDEVRVIEVIEYCVATIHMLGFMRLFLPGSFTPNEADYPTVNARGREIIEKAFGNLGKQLGDKDYILGDYSIADSALYYVERWAEPENIKLPPNLQAHLERMLARPAVQCALKIEQSVL